VYLCVLCVYLKRNDGKLSIIQLIEMTSGIAYGMQYLSQMGYVHRVCFLDL